MPTTRPATAAASAPAVRLAIITTGAATPAVGVPPRSPAIWSPWYTVR